MLDGDLSPGAKIRALHGRLEEGCHQLSRGFRIPRVSIPRVVLSFSTIRTLASKPCLVHPLTVASQAKLI